MKRVLVVDDSFVYRKIISEVINSIDGIRVSGQARDGSDAIEKVKLLKPDAITLDVEMPGMGGGEVLEKLQIDFPGIPVIMVSSLSVDSAKKTLDALQNGAYTFITKPTGANAQDELQKELSTIFNVLFEERTHSKRAPIQETSKIYRPDIIAIGISTGGPNALSEVIPKLPSSIPVPIVIVQHMPAGFTSVLANTLNSKSSLKVKEAEDGEPLSPGVVYIAPGGKQFAVTRASDKISCVITDDPPEDHCRPSVNHLFRSLAQTYHQKSLAIIMTGMGNDGVKGLKLMKRWGVRVIGQTEESCVVYGMPRAAREAGLVDIEVPLAKIVEEILKCF